MKLTDAAIKKAKPKTKPHKMADGGGLFLLVQPNGSKWWRYKYRFAGKEKLLSLGVYPDVSLKIAREDHGDARKLLANGSDPGAMKQTQKRQAKLSAANSFEVIAREFHAMKSPIWTVHHSTDWINTLEREAFPKIGHRPITEIEAPDVLDILRVIEARGAFEVRGRVFPLTHELQSPKLDKRSWVKISQIRTLSVERIGTKLGRSTPEELALVIEGINEIIGI